MMVIGALGTRTVPEDTSYEQPGIDGRTGETVFFADDVVLDAIAHGATVTVTDAEIGGTPVADSAITFDDDTGVVTLDGLARPARATANPVVVTFNGTQGQTRLTITDTVLLDAISAAQTITITAGSLTTADGNTRTLVPANDLRFEGNELIVTNPEYVDQRYRLTVTSTIPAYTTAGIPITRTAEAGRIVVITYDIGEYDLTVENLHPADQCVWEQEESPDGRGYTINNATFYTGATASNNTPVTQDLRNPRLGYIGKSGRFVAITDAH